MSDTALADPPPDRSSIEAAAAVVAGDVRRTPLWRLGGGELDIDGVELWLKLEQLQRSGSFKARGMFARLRQSRVPAAGAVIASGGNAGIAAAVAARALGVRCTVFVPAAVPAAKRAALTELGAAVVAGGAGYADALVAAQRHRDASGALWLHAYDQAEVVAGAGTLAREIELDAGVPDRVLVSVGGGGLVAGIAAWFEDRCAIDALEPVGAPTLHAAWAAGEPVDVEVGGLAADALGARRIGTLAWPLCRRFVTAVHRVPDTAILAAQRLLWQRLRLAVEPAAALPLAALHAGLVRPARGERVALVLCGANVDPAALGD